MKFSVIPSGCRSAVAVGPSGTTGIDHAVITFKDRDGHKSTVALDDASHRHALKVLFAKSRRTATVGSHQRRWAPRGSWRQRLQKIKYWVYR